MKYLIPVLGALLILIVACQPPVSLEKPNVSATALTGGDTLRLSWTAVASATGYNVYYDGHTTKDTSITGTQIDIGTPRSKIEVSAYNGSEESDKALTDLLAKVTTGLTAYAMSDPSPLNSFGFNASDGVCSVIDDTTAANNSKIDYLFEDRSPAPSLSLYSPNEYTTPYNSKIDVSVLSGTDFDALKHAPGPGTYNTKTAISQNSVYALWMGTSTTWSATDHFAKIKIETVSGTMITFRVAYQKTPGLRWFVSQ
jgi:hypothetical protein